MEVFKKAVCAGIVVLDNAPNISYILNDEDGFPLYEGDLSKPSFEFGIIPLYQAYISFCDLDQSVVSEIDKFSKIAFDNAEAMQVTLKSALDYMNPQNNKTWVEASKSMYKSHSSQIIDFLKNVSQQVKIMATTYGVK